MKHCILHIIKKIPSLLTKGHSIIQYIIIIQKYNTRPKTLQQKCTSETFRELWRIVLTYRPLQNKINIIL